jgi:hypothetical protein
MPSESWTRQQELHPLESLPQLVTGMLPSVQPSSVFPLCQEKKSVNEKSCKAFPLCLNFTTKGLPPYHLFLDVDFFRFLLC